MENNVNINYLAGKFFAARGEETYCDLFAAVFALPSWHFIAVGEMPNLSPLWATFSDYFDGQPLILAFTDTERLNKYVAENNLQIGSADNPVVINSADVTLKMSSENLILSIPTTSVISYVEGLAEKGIKGIFFNPNKDSDGFPLGLPELRGTKELIDSKKPKIEAAKIDFDALSQKANESGGAMSDLNNVFGETFALETWLFIARGSLPNVDPYIAANDGYAGGQQMIRAFTDSNRLQRFAVENNLTDSDGSAQMLEVPTGGIVEYLEQFIKDGVHGVWFNSDTVSDGYFIPLAQLRPVKEHLAKIGWKSSSEPAISNLEDYGFSKTPDGEPDVRIKIFKTGNVNYGTALVPFFQAIMPLLADYKGAGEFQKIFNFAPEAMNDLKESVFDNQHGQYVRLRTFKYQSAQAVADATTIDTNELLHVTTGASLLISFALLNIPDTKSAALYFGFEGGNGEVQKLLKAVAPALEAAGFVAAQTENNSSAQPAAADKNAADYIDWFRSGTIKFETTFKPFFHWLKPLLADYTGAGEYKFAFAGGIDEPGMQDLFEDVTSNAHGAYLKYRSCICERDGKTEDLQVIGSNLLTNTRTGEKLRVQLTLRKDLDAGTAKLTIVLQGPEAEVEMLNAAIQPALDESDFTVQLKLKKPPSPETAEEFVR